jgi:hypothetical protein
MKKEGYGRKTTFEKTTSGLVRVHRGRSGHGSTEFCRVVALTGFLSYPDKVPGRPARPVQV